MTADKYFEMCEQMGREPKEEEIPPNIGDFPPLVQYAIIAYSQLGDRVAADIGYLGKDYTKLNFLFELYEIDTIEEKEVFVEIIEWIERRAIKNSADSMKRQRDKMKNKHGSKKGASTPSPRKSGR